ncbi:MAG: hypothetical protein M0Z75_14400 [Nitrospiraceae bacterium]|nr:hypothetical protein [Nitrospiraceae bacterium]
MLKNSFRAALVILILFSSHPARSDQTDSQGNPKKAVPAESRLQNVGGILIPQGSLQLEPAFIYSNYSRHRLSISGFTVLDAIVIGQMEVSDLKRDIIQTQVTARYGITNRLEIEAKVPFLIRWDREVDAPGTTSATYHEAFGNGLGDIEGALYWHAIRANDGMPDIVLNTRVKSATGRSPYDLPQDSQGNLLDLPTGNGHWGVSAGFTAVKISDPAVLFGGVNYYWNFARNVGGAYGTIDPGNSIEYLLGMGYALNDKLSLDTSFQERFTMRDKQNGVALPETYINASTLSLGISYAYSSRATLELMVGIGVTVDAPDLQFTLSAPINVF